MNITTNRAIPSPKNATRPQTRPHVSFLDGLRGIAVLLVLAHHHGYLNSGWVGVDLFFVLSGYLITGILRSAKEEQVFWRPFWIKRTTRILPPFLLLLLLTMLLGFESSWRQLLAYLLSLGDVMTYLRPNFEPLQPLWSLAVEEHFYLLWPFAVRLLSRRTLLYLLYALLIVEPLARGIVSLHTHDWQVVYFLTPFRLDGLGLGALLALLMESSHGKQMATRWSGWATLLTAALWGAMRIGFGHRFTREDPTWIYNSACYSIVAFAAFFLIAFLLTHRQSIASHLLSWRGIVFIGEISYGLYLYQVPIKDVLMKTCQISNREVFWMDTPIIVLVAWLSYRLIETPLIRRGRRLAKTVIEEQALV